MYQIKGTIVGVADILFNRMTEETENSLRTGKTGGKFTDEQRQVEAMGKYHKNADGKAVIPGWMFKKVLSEGASKGGLKEQKRSLAPYILATVFVNGDVVLKPSAPNYIHETTGKRPPRTGGACLIKRPGFRAGWEAKFILNIIDDRRDADQIRRALEEAGILVGIGSWRPEYGRFIVKDWEVIKENEK